VYITHEALSGLTTSWSTWSVFKEWSTHAAEAVSNDLKGKGFDWVVREDKKHARRIFEEARSSPRMLASRGRRRRGQRGEGQPKTSTGRRKWVTLCARQTSGALLEMPDQEAGFIQWMRDRTRELVEDGVMTRLSALEAATR
jgi:hypothetical protein